jgi:nucleoside-diphosphate-sugar epimerase
MKNVLKGKEGAVPAATMEWVYSKDAAAGTVLALKAKNLKTRVFNLTMGKLTTADELSNAVKTVIPDAKLRIDKPADGTPALSSMTRAASLRRAKEILGYQPRYAMPDAVKDMVEFLR